VQEEGRQSEEKRNKKRRKKGKKWGKFIQILISRKNNRYFMKLVKNYFCKRKIYA
jgi:hypothetical protein